MTELDTPLECRVFKITTDDWYPAYKLLNGRWLGDTAGLVEVSFLKIPDENLVFYRVCAWGRDDMGMEKDFTDETEAWCCFLGVIGLEDVTHQALIDRGFVGA